MMTDFRRKLLAIIALLSLLTCPAFGAQSQSDWKQVTKRIGSPISVLTKSGETFEGNLVGAGEDWLRIKSQSQTREVKKAEVTEVRLKKRGGGNKAAWIAGLAAAGFGIGAAIGKATNPDDESGLGSFGPLIGGAVGAAGGALAGAVISHSRSKVIGEETIYKVP
jgi:hypothetical protein